MTLYQNMTLYLMIFGEVNGIWPGEDIKLPMVAGEGTVTSRTEPRAG